MVRGHFRQRAMNSGFSRGTPAPLGAEAAAMADKGLVGYRPRTRIAGNWLHRQAEAYLLLRAERPRFSMAGTVSVRNALVSKSTSSRRGAERRKV